MSQMQIYTANDQQVQVEVTFDQETVWLTQKQMALLFDKDTDTIGLHIRNILKEGELQEAATTEENSVVQQEGKRRVKRKVRFYNLDMILSVGYRVNSKKGTLFRQWATQRLKEYLVQGYTFNENRLREQLSLLQNAVQRVEQLVNQPTFQSNEAKGLLTVLSQYARSFHLLNQFDTQTLDTENLSEAITHEIQYGEAVAAIATLKQQLIARGEATDLFAKPKDESFSGILAAIMQTFGGVYLYPSIEEQAANLLYLIIKNHPFIDGNKRIGSFMFVWFLERNSHRLTPSGTVKINDNALVALALLVAQSLPDDKDLMIKLIINLVKNP